MTLVAVSGEYDDLAVMQAQIVTDADIEALPGAFDTFNAAC